MTTTSAWVSPRVKSADPWVRGRTPVSMLIGRMVSRSRPSTRSPLLEHLLPHDAVLDVLELGGDVLGPLRVLREQRA